MKFLNAFIEDCKYYDSEKIELKNILKHANLKNKKILDIGTGVGRLAFPLSKFAREVIALDKDKRFEGYFKKHKKKNVRFIQKSVENFFKKPENFDIILLAWPTLNAKRLRIIKRGMNKNVLLIYITCDNNSDYETVIDKIGVVKKGHFNKDTKNKQKFLKDLSKDFTIVRKRKLRTYYRYPNEKVAFRIIKNSLKLWFKVSLNEKVEKNLKNLINNHRVGKKVIFKEDIYFFIMKRK